MRILPKFGSVNIFEFIYNGIIYNIFFGYYSVINVEYISSDRIIIKNSRY